MSNSIKLNGYSSTSESMQSREAMNGRSGRDGFCETPEVDGCTKSAKCAAINPFIHRLKLSTLDKLQLAFMTVTVVPIRLVLIGISLVFAWFFAYLALLGRSKEDEKKPMTGWRRLLRPLAVFFARALFFMGGFHWVTVKGKRASSAEAPILATAPHSSYMDALSVTYLGLTSVVAKTEAQDVPFFGTLTKFTQPVLVSREDANSRQNTIREIQRRAATRGDWPQIVIFTEGTCTNRSCLINFKLGAFIPGVPVQPVCLKYKNKFDSITWTWNGPGALKVLWLTLCQFHTNFEIEYLPVYVPSEEEKKDVKLFGRNVRAQMARALGVPTVENSFEDGQAMMNAVKLHLPIAEDLVHINRVVRHLGLSQGDLKELANQLCEVCQSSSRITCDEFASHLKVSPSSQPFKELYTIFKKPGVSFVDLRQYVIILYLLYLPRVIDEVLQFAFNVYDYKSKGFLTIVELSAMLMALGLPRSVVDSLSASANGKELQISYGLFKSHAEHLTEYEELFSVEKSTNSKRNKSSKRLETASKKLE